MTLRPKKPLLLDVENRKFLGVCAGLANFLEVEAWTVRLVFLGALIIGAWFLIPLYFVAWFFMDESSIKLRTSISENHMFNHFKSVDYRKKLYRNTRDGKILGVCAGIADYLEVSAFAVRMIVLLLAIFFFFPALFYFGAALVIDKKPLSAYNDEPDNADVSYRSDSTRSTPNEAAAATGAQGNNFTMGMAPGAGSHRTERSGQGPREHFSKRHEFQYCARKFATLQTRLARLEAYVTSSRFKLNREFRNIS